MQLSQFGKYKIVEKLGQGAMGEVFRAHDPILKRDVAIKIVAGKLSADKVARERFLREAQSASQLTHSNIVTVYDYGEEQGTAFMVMELLGGHDLREVIEKRLIKGFDEKLAIMEQVLDGLAFAHSRGVVHRDIKPGNVHVLPNGQAKLMDFGLARQAQDGATTGVIMGTPFYISPEQAQGESATARSDVFAAGAMFYELLSGKRPFGGQTIPAVLYAVTQVEPEPLARLVVGIPEGVATLVARALSKAPQARYADGGEMLKALLQARRGEEGVEDAHPVQELGPPLSSLDETPPDMRDALADIALYLADRVPPLMVAGAVATFVEAPEEGAAAEIWAWAGRTLAGEPDLTMVDLVFHALYKLNTIGELRLLEDKKLLAYLKSVGEAIARACPPPERTRLRRALLMLGRPELLGGQGLRRLGDVDAPPLVPNTPGLRRLSLIEQRLRREAGVGPGAELMRRRIVSQALSIAATEAKDEKDLQGHLRRLENLGVKAGAGMVFRSLGGALADWAMPKGLAVDTLDLNTSPEIHAMRRIVALAEDPVEIARRFRHLVEAAIEQFNEGDLGRAVQVFDLAAQLASEKRVEPGLLQPVLKNGHESLDLNRVRTYMDRPDRHSQLQSVMRFFAAGLGPAPLLDQLEGEEKRERRRLLLDLLAVHAEPARALALERLEGSTRRPASDFVRRNWIYLLRQVPRTPGEPIEREIEAVARFATPPEPRLPREGGAPAPRADPSPARLPGPRHAVAHVGERARALRPRRRGARPGPGEPRPPGHVSRPPALHVGLASAARPRPLPPARVGLDHRPPRRAGHPGPLREPRLPRRLDGRDRGVPAPRRDPALRGPQGPGAPGPGGGARRHANPGGSGAAAGGRGAPREPGGREGRRPRPGAFRGHPRLRRPVGKTRWLRPSRPPRPPRPVGGNRNAEPPAPGGWRPARVSLLRQRARACGPARAPPGNRRGLPALRASDQRDLRVRSRPPRGRRTARGAAGPHQGGRAARARADQPERDRA